MVAGKRGAMRVRVLAPRIGSHIKRSVNQAHLGYGTTDLRSIVSPRSPSLVAPGHFQHPIPRPPERLQHRTSRHLPWQPSGGDVNPDSVRIRAQLRHSLVSTRQRLRPDVADFAKGPASGHDHGRCLRQLVASGLIRLSSLSSLGYDADMRRFLASLLVLTILAASLEYAADYAEVFERTTLAALPEGHSGDDGHTPTDHQLSCDNCHFGGVHLTGFTVAAQVQAHRSDLVRAPWFAPHIAQHRSTPPNPPPIV